MKPGDLVRITSAARPTRDFLAEDDTLVGLVGKLGIIVELETLINDKPMWSVMVEGELVPIRERNLEVVSDPR
jgi:hypothetical protein